MRALLDDKLVDMYVAFFPQMISLWGIFKSNKAVKVSAKDCQDVDDFLKACKRSSLNTEYILLGISRSLCLLMKMGSCLSPKNTTWTSRMLILFFALSILLCSNPIWITHVWHRLLETKTIIYNYADPNTFKMLFDTIFWL